MKTWSCRGRAKFPVTSDRSKLDLEIFNIDVTIICETPKISPSRQAILSSLSKILKIDQSNIGLKATTSEKIGIIGENKAIAVQTALNLITKRWKYYLQMMMDMMPRI